MTQSKRPNFRGEPMAHRDVFISLGGGAARRKRGRYRKGGAFPHIRAAKPQTQGTAPT